MSRIIGTTFTLVSLAAVGLCSVLFNVPRFLLDEPRSIVLPAAPGGPRPRRRYFAYPGPLRRHPGAERAYSGAYFALGIRPTRTGHVEISEQVSQTRVSQTRMSQFQPFAYY